MENKKEIKSPDKLKHEGKKFETAKKSSCPGQMYCPKSVSDQVKFAK